MGKSTAEEIRLRYLYRRMVMLGKAKVSLTAAKLLVGPDCAYHLYAALSGGRTGKGEQVPGMGRKGNTGRKGQAARK